MSHRHERKVSMRAAAIAGIGRTEFSTASGRTTLALAADATRRALSDAGLTATDVDGIVTFQANDCAFAVQVGGAIGANDLSVARDLTGGGLYVTSAVSDAFRAVESGACDVVVVFRSLNGRSGTRYGRGEQPALELSRELQFAALSGLVVPPMLVGMWARRHMHRYGTTAEDLGHVAITQRRHAGPNPHALQRRPLSMDDYLGARWIYEPFRLYDCCLETDGAVALVVTTLDRARDLDHVPIVKLADAEAHTHGGWFTQGPDLSDDHTSYAARKLWARTDLRPADVDVACLYDGFTYVVLSALEGYGFCPAGEAGKFVGENRATYGGDVVVNPHGGLLSEGYLHGLNHHFEAVLQLRQAAGDRTVVGAEVALVTGGEMAQGGAILYGVDR